MVPKGLAVVEKKNTGEVSFNVVSRAECGSVPKHFVNVEQIFVIVVRSGFDVFDRPDNSAI